MEAEDFQEELTCAICLDYFADPVSIECGHNFCRGCLCRTWAPGGSPVRCPECRRPSAPASMRPNWALARLTERMRRRRLGPVPAGLCGRHWEPLRLFCEDDQRLVCLVCRESQEHQAHTMAPADEACKSYREKLLKTQSSLTAKMKKVIHFQDMEVKNAAEWKEKMKNQRMRVIAEFAKLHVLLTEEEQLFLQGLRQEEEETKKRQSENISRLNQMITSLKKLILEVKEKSQSSTLELLQNPAEVLTRCENQDVSYSSEDLTVKTVCRLPMMKEMLKRFQGSVRLCGGKRAFGGTVEVYENGVWGIICSSHWDDADASVVCHQLRLGGKGVAKQTPFSELGLIPVYWSNVRCRGDEENIVLCERDIWQGGACSEKMAAAVLCSFSHGPVFPILRLVGGSSVREGRVEVYHAGQWGTVCDDQWDDADAEVVCRQLGLSGIAKAWNQAYFGEGSGPVMLDEVRCTGNELSIEQCPKSSWGEHNCDHKEDAGVSCTPLTDGVIRLAGGEGGHEGRLEVYHRGQWGTVCNDGWTDLNTYVVCRQLGFKYGKQASANHFEESMGPRWLEGVSCSGKEASFLQCSRGPWGRHACSHREDVGISCYPGGNGFRVSLGFPIRLMDGENEKEGRVEVFINGQWGTVCDDGWTDEDATVICRQLGYKGPARARSMAYFGEGEGPIHMDNVKCTGNERSLADCVRQDIGDHDCRHSEDAGVICDYLGKKASGNSSKESLSSVCGLRLLPRRQKRIIGGKNSLRYGNSTRNYVVRVGDYHTLVPEEFEEEIRVEQIVTHRLYRPHSNDYDIALVRLQGPEEQCARLSSHILPACLPRWKERPQKRAHNCYVTGWGDTGPAYSRTLQQAAIPLLPKRFCEHRYKGLFTRRMLCAGNLHEHKRVDSCQGDSGGPLVCERPGERWVVYGVTSWGYGCGAKDSPGVYTKVSAFVPWIKRVTKL